MGRRKRKGRADIVVGAKMSGGGIHAGVAVGFVDEQSSGFPFEGPDAEVQRKSRAPGKQCQEPELGKRSMLLIVEVLHLGWRRAGLYMRWAEEWIWDQAA